jgi:hypothetical protein
VRSRQPETQKEERARPRAGGKQIRWLGPASLLSLVAVGVPQTLQAPLNIYDGGLLLTLARFTDLSRLPYRDLWTLYGPGPPLLGSITTHLFGRGVLGVQLAHVGIQVALLLGVYFLLRRLGHRWLAVVLAVPLASFAYLPNHFHFSLSLSLIVWALWLLASASPPGGTRRATLAGIFIGLSFLGRYEFLLVGPLLIGGLWWFLRPTLGEKAARRFLLWGLVPPFAFAVYLVAVVGSDRAYLNLVEYPFRFYSKPFCRGVPTPWTAAFTDLIAPVRGRLWTANGLVLGVGTYVAPAIGLACLVVGRRQARRRHVPTALILACGLLALLIWLEMRPRAGGEPHPAWVFTLLGIGFLMVPSQRRSTRASIVVGAIAVVMALVLTMSWLPDRVRAWTEWPAFDRVTGFAQHPRGSLNDRQTWDAVADAVHDYAAPGEEILVALHENRGHFANAPIFYWYVDRPPATRFIEFDPCLTDTQRVQRLVVEDIRSTNVVVTTSFFPQDPPPLGPHPTALDAYLKSNFVVFREVRFPEPPPPGFQQTITVLVRNGAAPVR